jgi:hypothetical protein
MDRSAAEWWVWFCVIINIRLNVIKNICLCCVEREIINCNMCIWVKLLSIYCIPPSVSGCLRKVRRFSSLGPQYTTSRRICQAPRPKKPIRTPNHSEPLRLVLLISEIINYTSYTHKHYWSFTTWQAPENGLYCICPWETFFGSPNCIPPQDLLW